MIKNFLVLMRPKHYVKNILIFVPIMYSFNLTDAKILLSGLVCFAALCMVASAIYAINDIFDFEIDKAHSINKTRPIAAGLVSKRAAAVFALFLFSLGFSLIFFFSNALVLFFFALYAILNVAYSFKLKHFAIIDCFCIAAGFVMRIYIGGAVVGGAIDEIISEWLFLTITAVSLFLAFGKRRGEMLHVNGKGRKVLGGYNLDFLNGIIFSCAGVSIIFYALWAMTSVSAMIYTVPVVIFIVCKYLLNVHGASYGDPVTVIFNDKILVFSIFIFSLMSVIFLYSELNYEASLQL